MASWDDEAAEGRKGGGEQSGGFWRKVGASLPQRGEPREVREARESRAPNLRGKHILLVEDEIHLASGVKYNLEAEGYRVTAVADGPSALTVVAEDPQGVDLLILDLMLPGMSGYAVCETLRESGNDVPVLMFSARTLSEDRIRGFDVGADQYLQKPFDLGELLSRARNLLSRGVQRPAVAARAEPVGSVYQFGQATVNFDTFEVTVAGQRMRLTYMELKLLRYLVENEGVVVSRSELLENVWGMSTSPTTRTVDNFVMRLRKYFEQDPSEPQHFLSVRGAGYRFVSIPEPGEDEGEQRA